MSDIEYYLETLAAANRHGYAFLLAYGLTWLAAGTLWRLKGPRAGAYAALFQGIVALPIALSLTALTAGGDRPAHPGLDALVVYLSMGQLFALPVVIVLVAARRHTVAVLTLAVVTTVHFAPYSWLYRTPFYLGMAAVLCVGLAVLVHRSGPDPDDISGGRVCLWTGAVLFGSSLLAVIA